MNMKPHQEILRFRWQNYIFISTYPVKKISQRQDQLSKSFILISPYGIEEKLKIVTKSLQKN